jgi:preprotein translocase subunit SecE
LHDAARRRLSRNRIFGFSRLNGIALAKVNPGEFIRQVRVEASKVVWPTGRETAVTVVMVIIMTAVLGVFFLGVDSFFSWVVKTLLSFAS